MSGTNEIEVRDLITEHVARTGSTVGQRVLDEWESLRGSFRKLFPTDYKRVLAEMELEESGETAEVGS